MAYTIEEISQIVSSAKSQKWGVSSGNRFKIERNLEYPRRLKVVDTFAEAHEKVVYAAGILEVPDLIINSMPGWYKVQFLLSRQAEQDWINLPPVEKVRLNQLAIYNTIILGSKMFETTPKTHPATNAKV